MAATQSARDAAYARILKPSPGSRPGYRLVGSTRITSTGSSATTGLRSAVAPATGLGGWRTSPPAAPVAGRKRRGQRGRSPPPASLGDTRSVAPASMLAEQRNGRLRSPWGLRPGPGKGRRARGGGAPPRSLRRTRSDGPREARLTLGRRPAMPGRPCALEAGAANEPASADVAGHGHRFRLGVDQPDYLRLLRFFASFARAALRASVTRRAASYESHPTLVSSQPSETTAGEAGPRRSR